MKKFFVGIFLLFVVTGAQAVSVLGETVNITIASDSSGELFNQDVTLSTPFSTITSGTTASGVRYSLSGMSIAGNGNPGFQVAFNSTGSDTNFYVTFSGFDSLIDDLVNHGGGTGGFGELPVVSAPIVSIEDHSFTVAWSSLYLPAGSGVSTLYSIAAEAAVPIPAPLALLGIGMLALGISRRK